MLVDGAARAGRGGRRQLPLRPPRGRRRGDAARARRRARLRRRGDRARRGPAGLVLDLRPHLPGRRRRRPGPPRRSAARTPCAASWCAATSAAASSATRPPTCPPTRVDRGARRRGVRRVAAPRATPASATPPRSASAPTRPSTASGERRVESYVLDRDRPRALRRRGRGLRSWSGCAAMTAFDSVDALVAQMADDVRPGPRAAAGAAREADAGRPDRRPPRQWFLQHGLSYFVPEERARRPGRAAPAPDRAAASWSWWSLATARRRAAGVGRAPGRPSRPALLISLGARGGDVVRADRAARPPDRDLGAGAHLRQPAHAAADDDARAAAAADVHHVPVHQHRGLAGRRRTSAAARCG